MRILGNIFLILSFILGLTNVIAVIKGALKLSEATGILPVLAIAVLAIMAYFFLKTSNIASNVKVKDMMVYRLEGFYNLKSSGFGKHKTYHRYIGGIRVAVPRNIKLIENTYYKN